MKIIVTISVVFFFLQFSFGQCAGGDPSVNGPNWNFSISIEDNFNIARRFEEVDRSLTTNCLGNMTPIPGGWTSATDDEIALYIHNSEREARGILPLECIEGNLDMVAQAHAEWQIANSVFSHGGDPALGSTSSYSLCGACSTVSGSSPFDRMNQSAPLMGQWEAESENIAVFVTSGITISDAVPRAMYLFIYQDQSSLWGHRHNILLNFSNNFGSSDNEGFLGVGVHQGGPYIACPFGCASWNTASIVTIDYYDPQGSASGFTCTTVLPIELLTFEAIETEDKIKLTWTAISTSDNGYFVVEKASGNRDFEEIGEVLFDVGKGDIVNYCFTDEWHSNLTAYYRLKMTDFDSSFTYSKVISVKPKSIDDIVIFPNPVKDFIYFKNLPLNPSTKLTIFDLMGQIIFSENINSKGINLGELKAGLYIYQIDSGNKTLSSNRFVKI